MKTARIIFAFLLVVPALAPAQDSVAFSDFFKDRTLRIDYYHAGNSDDETITIDHLYNQGIWSGNPRHLVDPFGYGRYDVKVYDRDSDRLIYSKGFDSYFGEFRTTAPAKAGTRRTYHESALIPFPLKHVRVVFEGRDKSGSFSRLFSFEADPSDYHVNDESVRRGDEITEVLKSGDPHEKVDIVIIAEGYTAAEKEKFGKDLKRYVDCFFNIEPYKSRKDRFNISGVFSPSPQSGVDEPRQGIYKKTLLGASFNSLDSDRYLLIEDNKTLRDIAAQAPYDVMMVMVNGNRYGGGGFYGYYSAFTSDGGWNDYVFLHEFGHTFGGLADEYYTSDVAYEDFYPEGVEPPEPNLTRLTDPANLKWKDLVSPGLSIPTEWGHALYDSLTASRDRLGNEEAEKIAGLKRDRVPADSIEHVEASFRAAAKDRDARVTDFMEHHPLRGLVGAFEGGGYLSKGLYRPTVNSIMNQFNKSDRSFYPVNERAIERMIDYYSGK